MKESSLWEYVRKGMLGKWHPTRIESSAGNGVPDVSYGLQGKQGWIELKHIHKWPKRATTKVKLPLRPEQKLWISARGSISGDVWALVRIQDDFFLVSWRDCKTAAEQGWTQAEWSGICTMFGMHWHGRIDFNELLEILYES